MVNWNHFLNDKSKTIAKIFKEHVPSEPWTCTRKPWTPCHNEPNLLSASVKT